MRALDALKHAFKDFGEDECPRMAASMSYFTVFSLAPLLVLVLLIVGIFVDPSDMQGRIHAQLAALIGSDGARQIDDMIRAASKPTNRGLVTTLLGILALVFGATGAFGELQSALNKAWEVKPDPRRGGLRAFIGKRILSLGMVATISFLLLVSLVVSAAISAFGDVLGGWLGGLSGAVMQAVQMLVSLGVTWALFAAMFRVLPDAQVAWRDVRVGALFTTALFVAVKYLIGLYLSKSNPGSTFGAAGALAVIMVWIYYSAMIVFMGAEFTQAWAVGHGREIEPSKGAVREEPRTNILPWPHPPGRRTRTSPAGSADGAPYP